jgi:hypothetical protein
MSRTTYTQPPEYMQATFYTQPQQQQRLDPPAPLPHHQAETCRKQ